MATVRLKRNPRVISDFMQHDSRLWQRLEEIGEFAVGEGKALAPVGTVEHTTKGGYVNHPGDFRRSIKWRIEKGPSRMKLVIYSRDWKAMWLEFGTVKMKKRATFAKLVIVMESQGFHFKGTGDDDEFWDDAV